MEIEDRNYGTCYACWDDADVFFKGNERRVCFCNKCLQDIISLTAKKEETHERHCSFVTQDSNRHAIVNLNRPPSYMGLRDIEATGRPMLQYTD